MKNGKILLFNLLLISTFCLISCDKYNSKIIGKVFYTDINDNIDYPASGAVIAKMVERDDSLRAIVAVSADANGEFLFDHTTKGTWILSGKFEKDSTFYYGLSESFTTSGEDEMKQIIKLKPLIKNDME